MRDVGVFTSSSARVDPHQEGDGSERTVVTYNILGSENSTVLEVPDPITETVSTRRFGVLQRKVGIAPSD